MLNLEDHQASITNVNLRAERHGEERQLAADIKFKLKTGGEVLDDLEPGLRATVFRSPKAGEQQPLIGESLTAVKFPHLAPLALTHKFPGYELTVRGPLDEEDEGVFLAAAELKKISAQPLEGGSVEMIFTVSAEVEVSDVAELCALYITENVVIKLEAPARSAANDDAGADEEEEELDDAA